jgi:hypothetical protein
MVRCLAELLLLLSYVAKKGVVGAAGIVGGATVSSVALQMFMASVREIDTKSAIFWIVLSSRGLTSIASCSKCFFRPASASANLRA